MNGVREGIMGAERAVEGVYARLMGENAIPLKIRARKGVAAAEVSELFLAIDVLIGHYRRQDRIPKKLALAFVDIFVGFSVADDFYDQDELERYENIGIALQDKAGALFDGA
ncbi:hypothetical protein [Erwinia persicina]|uniref:hypothetical protein n=1 Tax=Erwinia persicina TaxID=55211 RepID=UPI00177DED7B|nr:hypothetical protein [Erwinia persicina]MBD8165262.1 hypothetical protein [Erwinia persicina]